MVYNRLPMLPGPDRMGQLINVLDGAGETLVLLGIVVLEADLEFDSLQKLTLLAGLLGNLEDLLHALVQSLLRNFGSHVFSC